MSSPGSRVVLEQKLDEIRGGRPPRVVDLFAGCGGLSLGFLAAGFEIVGAVEIDEDAARCHAANFFSDRNLYERHTHGKPRDITMTPPDALAEALGLGQVATAVDVLVGSPPCQAFTRVGRAKLRSIAGDDEAHLVDPRADLYERYIEYVEAFRPLAIVVENVPEFLNYGGRNLADTMAEALEDLGYRCAYTLLNAVHYGVPQMRERVFMLAVAEHIGCEPSFPEPTHWWSVPTGYKTVQSHALKTAQPDLFRDRQPVFVQPPSPSRRLERAVTAAEALRDLPRLDPSDNTRPTGAPRSYRADVEPSPFARMMREWPGFESNEVEAHLTRRLPRDYRIFQRMRPGDQYPEARKIALEILREELKKNMAHASEGFRVSEEVAAIQKSLIPPYDPAKFANKWRKMEPDAPARTLMAHLAHDGYTHIHYDSSQGRTISVREAARLQSFPDGFSLPRSMNAAFRLIGNAVPPRLARSVGQEVARIVGYKDESVICNADDELEGGPASGDHGRGHLSFPTT